MTRRLVMVRAMTPFGMTPYDVRRGPELTGQLVQPDGSQFLVRSGSGFERTGTQGPLLDEPSVSRERLKVLLTGPEVRPEKP
ncbi:hypothetical protein [Streptomyces microflavus]|uniref:hypothetical protein n=1 Tax=Streptomyces microflavus TaxID=1919 RepID=UPI00380FC839